ncbi:hypothetical protein M5K25_004720 [Dendrobium thyrsiflorum]|uniref:Uncharacterized protein n=1 Tax=Dendrobium thyrsiflorum TaxID=117978 RepID=A0ABD0VMS0_DENTH
MACRFYLFSLILVVLLFTTNCFAQDDAETTPTTDDSGTPDVNHDSSGTVCSTGPSDANPPSLGDPCSITDPCLKCQDIPPSIPCSCP